MAIEARDIATLISVVNWARMPPFAFDVEPLPGRRLLLDQGHVRPAEAREVERDAAADDPRPDDRDVRVLRHRRPPSGPYRKPDQ